MSVILLSDFAINDYRGFITYTLVTVQATAKVMLSLWAVSIEEVGMGLRQQGTSF